MTRDGDNRRNANNGGARRTTADKQCKGSTRVEEDERWKSSGATRRAANKRGEVPFRFRFRFRGGGGGRRNRRFRFLPGFFGTAGSKTRTGPNKKNFEFFL
ncbi:hypothetical protein ACOSQ3_014011 [Xanthoceras sorbifolium]